MAGPQKTPNKKNTNQVVSQVVTSPTTATSQTRINNIDAKEKLINWIEFNILIAIMPIVLRAAIQLENGKPIVFPDLFSHGELLLISVAITADAMGELILKGKTKGSNGRAIGFCLLIGVFAMAWFGSLTGGTASNAWGFTILSLMLFAASVYVGLNCKAAAEV